MSISKNSWKLLVLIALVSSFIFCSEVCAVTKAVQPEPKEEIKAIKTEIKCEGKAVKEQQKDN